MVANILLGLFLGASMIGIIIWQANRHDKSLKGSKVGSEEMKNGEDPSFVDSGVN